MTAAEAIITAILYAQQFAGQYNLPIDKCPIEFSSKKCIQVAHGCEWHGYVENSYHPKTREVTSKRIILSLNHWKTIHPAHRRELIWHELGHCAADLKHVNGVDIMRPRVYSTKIDYSNWNSLVERLGEQINSNLLRTNP